SSFDWVWDWIFAPENVRSATASKRGHQPAVISAALRNRRDSNTEVAIVTPSGLLRTYIYDPTTPVPDPPEDGGEDLSKGECQWGNSDEESKEPALTGSTYRSIEEDLELVHRYLTRWNFCAGPPTHIGLRLDEQVRNFLSGKARSGALPSDNPALVRIIIFSGHYNNKSGKFTLGQNAEYRWTQLAEDLRSLPRHVIAIPILACCFAGDGAKQIFDKTENTRLRPQVILMASSQEYQPSYSSFRGGGDHFLNAFFKTLKAVARHENCQSWEDFMALIRVKLNRRRMVFPGHWQEKNHQDPLFMKNTNITPCEVFSDLLGTTPS
ncbi:hypothetical protein FRC06_011208, partial [Ceratobasidium sp. 370]